MARKRLNKKVALMGSVIFVFLALAVIGIILYLSRDPEKFIEDAEVAMRDARQASDEEAKEEYYKKAAYGYHKARSLAKTDSLKIEMFFKLVELYQETDKWRNVLGCWNKIIQLDPANVEARYGQLRYLQIMAGSDRRHWKEIGTQASEFIDAVDEDILAENTDQWESSWLEEKAPHGQLGPYLYLLRGRAVFENVQVGAVINKEESLKQAVADLEKVLELDPNNVDVYWYLAQTIIAKGEILASRGNFEERDKALEEANKLLGRAIEITPDDPTAYINHLLIKSAIARKENLEKAQALEKDYLSLTERFSSSPEVFVALYKFYLMSGYKNLDKAQSAIEKAIELDKENVSYAIILAGLHFQKASIYGQQEELYKAVEIAESGLESPGTQEVTGPKRWEHKRNRIELQVFLSSCYFDLLSEPADEVTEDQKQQWLKKFEQKVVEIEQYFGSGEDPQVVKWQGMLEFVKGDVSGGTKKMYAAYEQLKASDRRDAQLSYVLAKAFDDSSELGASAEFFANALSIADRNLQGKIDDVKPESLLEYGDLLLKLKAYTATLNIVTFFEQRYWPNRKSKILRLEAYIAMGEFDSAEQELAKAELAREDVLAINMKMMRARIDQVRRAMAQLSLQKSENIGDEQDETADPAKEASMQVELKRLQKDFIETAVELLPIRADYVGPESIEAISKYYIAEGNTKKARDIVDEFVKYFPDNTTVQFYKTAVLEPDIDNIGEQKIRQIKEKALSNIKDPVNKALSFGLFYTENSDPNAAIKEFKKVLDTKSDNDEITNTQRIAASYIFDTALKMSNWNLAEEIADIVRLKNLDGCQGKFFYARIAAAKGQFEQALSLLNESLSERPVFSHAYLLRSNVYSSLGDETLAIEDAKKATLLNPLDGTMARRLAMVLYQRNDKLGANVLYEQISEAKRALDIAMSLNMNDRQLLSFYAEYISDESPFKALAIRQSLQKSEPSIQNAVMLAELATRIAVDEKDESRKKALFDIAGAAFEEAMKINPSDRVMLYNYAEYFRAKGEPEKASQLLVQSENKQLLWRHYYQNGQFDEAMKILEQLHQEDSKDTNVIKGLLVVSEKIPDVGNLKKYSEILISLEDTVVNRLNKIQAYYRVGLTKEADDDLEAFKEKYPDDNRALSTETWSAMKDGQFEQALELATRNLEANQEDYSAWRLRGHIYVLMSNYEKAILDLKKSILLLNDPATKIMLARAYWSDGRADDAIVELKSVVDNPEFSVEANRLLEQIYLGFDRSEALKGFYDEVLKKFPDDIYWNIQAGNFALKHDDLAKAEKCFSLVLKNPKVSGANIANSLDGYLESLILQRKFNEVFEEGRSYVESPFAPIVFLKMAAVRIQLDDRKTAVKYCRTAIAKAESNESVLPDVLRRVYTLVGREEVESYCNEKLSENPNSSFANLTMYNLSKIDGEYNKALEYIDKCIQTIEPGDTSLIEYVFNKTTLLTLAYAKTSDKNYLRKAIKEHESLLEKMPNNEVVSNNLAFLLAENDEMLADALEYARKAYEAMPGNPDFLDTYAYVLYKNDKYQDADKFIHASIQQYEAMHLEIPAEVYWHMGMIKEKLKLKTEAVNAYKEALRLGKDKLSDVVKQNIQTAVERLSQ